MKTVYICVLLLAVGVGVFIGYYIWVPTWEVPAEFRYDVFKDTLTIVLAVIAVAVALLGYLTYQWVSGRLETKATELARQVHEEIAGDLMRKTDLVLARTRGGTAYGFWRIWWRLLRSDYEILEAAIRTQRAALASVEKMQLEELSEEEREAIYQQKSNIATYIVCKLRYFASKVSQAERAEQISVAKKYGLEAYNEAAKYGDKYDWKANYAAVLKSFGTDSEKQVAQEIITIIEQRHTNEEISADEMDDYRELFGNC